MDAVALNDPVNCRHWHLTRVITTDREISKAHVGIVGARVSGFRCVEILLRQSFTVAILEARDRIGGRICQSDELGYTVDNLADETNTPLHHWNSKQLIYDSLGTLLPDEKAERLSTLLWEIITEACEVSEAARQKDGGKSIPLDESFYDFVKKKAAERLNNDEERQILAQMSEMWGAYVGEPVWKQSLRFSWMGECCGGEELFVESSYSTILDKISETPRKQADIILNSRIVSVITQDEPSDPKVVLLTTTGDKYIYCFKPAPPSRLSSAIIDLKLSQLEKVFINFPSAFWISDPTVDSFPSYVYQLARADIRQGHQLPTAGSQEIWNLPSLAAPDSHPTLLFYLYGDCSRHIVNSIHGKSKAERDSFLRAFFFPYYSRLPSFDAQSEACVPKAFLATEWLKDDLCGNGSYCNFQVGTAEADQDVLAIRQGCPEQGLWFCGEQHAAPFEECGTVAVFIFIIVSPRPPLHMQPQLKKLGTHTDQHAGGG
ncbi:hypothetical protein F4809DRAFT_654016 [Biscogniauxia mediterranea]|nr:hypothetical protein F4809DRAFT_654016 [Biscogniauxia mediterranea]